ncbi:MAG: efflux transporter outer membrane subunit [Alcaligenaceae bacterium]|nr:efflux transporter outer membrane subunit [Alcaligenaceae bacterium]
MNIVKHFSPKLSVVLLATILAGCSLSPNYERPGMPVPDQFPGQGSSPAQSDGIQHTADLGWETFFKDERLKALIPIALENNRDMRIAIQRVEEARALYGIQRSDRFPQIGVNAQQTAQRMPEDMRAGGALSPSVTRSNIAGIGMTNFELDFFGRQRSLSEAAFEQYLATQQARTTVQINLIGQLASTYFTLRNLEAQKELVNKTIKSRQGTLNLVQSRYSGGVASILDVNQAKTTLEAAKASLAEITRGEMRTRNALQLILGQPAPANLPPAAPFTSDVVMGKLPTGLPSALLTRRPDILAAENRLKAANANIGAARAAFFPSISLTGLLGIASPDLGSLFDGGNGMWSFNPVINIPIFTAGKLSNNLNLAEVRSDIAVAEYEKSIQTAFREVADALAGESTYQSQLEALRAQQAAAYETLKIANLRYSSGIDSFLQVQSAEVALFTVQQGFLQTGFDSIQNRIELYKALGGGWTQTSVISK